MDKVYIVTVEIWLDYDHHEAYVAGVYSSVDKANELHDKLVPIFEQEQKDCQIDAFDIDVTQATIDTPTKCMTVFLKEENDEN